MKKQLSLEDRLELKARLERVLSEVLSEQYDCDIKIKFKPEKEELLNEDTDSKGTEESPQTDGSDSQPHG